MITFNVQWSDVLEHLSELKTIKEKVAFLDEYLFVSKKFLLILKQKNPLIYGLNKEGNWPLYYSGDKSMDEHFEVFFNDVIESMRRAEFDTPVDDSFITFNEIIEHSNFLIKQFKNYTLPRVELEIENLKSNNKPEKKIIKRIWGKEDRQFITLIERLKQEKFIQLDEKENERIKICFLQPYKPPSNKFKWASTNTLIVYLINTLIAQKFMSEEFSRYKWIATSEMFINKDLIDFRPDQLKKTNQRVIDTKKILDSDKIDSILKEITV